MPIPISQALAQGLSTGPLQNASGVSFTPSGPSAGNPATALDRLLSRKTKSYQFPEDLPKYYMTFYISDFQRHTLSRIGHLKRREVIRLPLPLNIADLHHEEWREYEYQMIAGLAAEMGPGLDNLGGQALTAAVPFAEGLLQAAFQSPAATAAASGAAGLPAAIAAAGGKLLSSLNLGGEIGRAIGGLRGVAPNMFQTVLYRGPVFKQIAFQLKLCPRNLTESTQIRNIINRLHVAMAPKFNAKAGKLLFDFPDIFEIAYWPNAGWLCKFKPCVLENFHVSYNGAGGKVAFYAGALGNNPPESVIIDLGFKELEYWTKENYQDPAAINNNPFSGTNKEFQQPQQPQAAANPNDGTRAGALAAALAAKRAAAIRRSPQTLRGNVNPHPGRGGGRGG